jgi:hypothetical protein
VKQQNLEEEMVMEKTRMIASIHKLRRGLVPWVVEELKGQLPRLMPESPESSKQAAFRVTEGDLLKACRLVESMTIGLAMAENAVALGTIEMLSSEMQALLLQDDPSREEFRQLIVQNKILSNEG